MGVDAQIMLPADVTVQHVAEAMAMCCGYPHSRHPLGDHGDDADKWFLQVEGWTVQETPSALAGTATIMLEHPDVPHLDGEKVHHVMFHLEFDHGRRRLLMPRSTPFWIAMGRKLVDFFGGSMDYQDCDAVEVDYESPKPREWNDPDDGESWQQFQIDMEAITPVTRDDILACAAHAAYECEYVDKWLKERNEAQHDSIAECVLEEKT
jgi:hypothetical protein